MSIQERYKSGCALGLSIVQLVIGVMCITAHVSLFFLWSPLMPVGHGIWTGILFVITGSLGIASSCSKTKCLIVAFLVMSILSAVFTVGLLAPSAIDLAIAVDYRNYYYYNRYNNAYIIPAGIMMVLAVLEAVMAIVSSGLACHALCSGGNQQQTPVIAGQVRYVMGPDGQQQAVIVPEGQQPPGYNPDYRGPAPLPSAPGAPQHGSPGNGPPPHRY